VEIALGLVFDPRSRDFPFAGLTMAAVPVWTLALLYRRKSDAGVNAEAVFAGLLGAAALFLVLHEGVHNWQSLWTAAAFLLFGAALWSPRSVAAWRGLSNLRNDELAVQPIAVASLPQPKPQASGFVVAASQIECDK
jgi:DMSO reductase anchor subunit